MAMPCHQTGTDEATLRSIAFAGLVTAVLVLVWVNRGFALAARGRNAPLAILFTVAAIFFTMLFAVPQVAGLFQLSPLHRGGVVAVALLALALLAVLMLAKRRFRGALAG